MQESPSDTIMDTAVTNNRAAGVTHVTSEIANFQGVDQYTVGESYPDVVTRPFMHSIVLKGEKGIPLKIKGLFDDSAMVNSICNTVYPNLQKTLGSLIPSLKILRMANGSHVPSNGCWIGNIQLGGRTVKGAFKIFPSGGGWSILVRKPLLKQFQAVHDYESDMINIPVNGKWSTLVNECNTVTGEKCFKGG